MAKVHLPYPLNDKSIVVKYDEPKKYELVPTEPVKPNYTPIGEKIDIQEGINCYITGSKDSKAGIIFFYDVAGYSDNVFQDADILGKRGYRVIITNFWANEPTVIELLDDEIISKTSELLTYYPRAKKLDVPTIIVGGFDDPDYTDGINSFKNKGLAEYSYYKVFPEVYHGFLSSTADYSNHTVSKVANNALSIVATYFDQILKARQLNPEVFKRSGDIKEFKRTNTVLGHFGMVVQKGWG
ncbi:hypothetical protein AYI70_g982 [Smittium culicis]|uniref:Dienelactone hydrolase domain-containing protein n=1 Tax=Smittium culicis TaxID=133412 RepID=A0A1R1YEE8_9FUNG|nr:hypothetical protein AYI70_g982 [Smittium culicis]